MTVENIRYKAEDYNEARKIVNRAHQEHCTEIRFIGDIGDQKGLEKVVKDIAYLHKQLDKRNIMPKVSYEPAARPEVEGETKVEIVTNYK